MRSALSRRAVCSSRSAWLPVTNSHRHPAGLSSRGDAVGGFRGLAHPVGPGSGLLRPARGLPVRVKRLGDRLCLAPTVPWPRA